MESSPRRREKGNHPASLGWKGKRADWANPGCHWKKLKHFGWSMRIRHSSNPRWWPATSTPLASHSTRVRTRSAIPRRILVVSFGPPDFDRSSGSLRFYSLLQILSQQHEVTFYAPRRFYSPSEGSDSRGQRYIDALTSLGIDVHFGPPTLLGPLLARTDHSIFFEFFHTAEYALQFARLHRPDLPIVVDSVDLAYVRQYRRATYVPDRLTARIT